MDKFLIRNLLKKREDDNQVATCKSASSSMYFNENKIRHYDDDGNSKKLDINWCLEPREKRFCFDNEIHNHERDTFSIENLLKKDNITVNSLHSNKCEIVPQQKESNENKSELQESVEKRICCNIKVPKTGMKIHCFKATEIMAENLNLRYGKLFCKAMADYVYQRLEKEVEYFTGDLMRVKVYGKWHNIPRKQVSYGDPGLSYTFSGNCVPAVPWSKCEIIKELKEVVEFISHHSFNFVLVNRYKDGLDHMGEHRDDEKDLVPTAPIASLSFGQARDFVFRHKDSRGQRSQRKIDPVKLELEHGSALFMLHPTNQYWYHSLPVRKKIFNTRINLTFRDMVKKV